MSLPVRTTPEADTQIREIDNWWRNNRSASPDLFVEELAVAFDTIASAPQIGRAYRRSPVPGVRRLLLKGSRYHVYYVPGSEDVTSTSGMFRTANPARDRQFLLVL